MLPNKMNRKIMGALEEWRRNPFQKPLVLQGPRQVGKTWVMLEFGRLHYANVAYFNFETNPELTDIFSGSIEPSHLIPLLSRAAQQPIVPRHTLILFDEVQLCERALTSLKYFCEMAREYQVVAGGSLLGIAVNRETYSFPVGKVDMLTMHPMDFEEYLWALDETELAAQIRNCLGADAPMPAALHRTCLDLYRQYLLVGGMPECVHDFVLTRDPVLVRHAQKTIIAGYLSDMSKYNRQSDVKKTEMVYRSATAQLSKRNTRFQYKLIKKGARAAEFENAIEWLALSGLVSQVYRVSQPRKPLYDNRDIDAFKIYYADVGLLCTQEDLNWVDVLNMSAEIGEFKGGMVENYVNTQLVANGYQTYYWESERTAEVDFIIQHPDGIIPIEVKSADNVQAKSMRVYMNRYHPDYAVKLSTKNFGFENGIKTVPLYAAFCI